MNAKTKPAIERPKQSCPFGTNGHCRFNSSGRCSCGLHRAPERATYVMPQATDNERLAIEL